MSPWRQRFKWTVYALLLVNFVVYFFQDIESARYTVDASSTWLEYGAAYVTSIDLAAWFMLIILLELETYVLVGRRWTGRRKWVVHGVRLLCWVAILHTSFSYDTALQDFQNPRPLPVAADVCGYQDGGWSFLRNREYTLLDSGNCAHIGQGPAFFAIGDDAVLTDGAGLREGLILAWTDLIESVAWLLIVLLIELVVRMRRSDVTRSVVTRDVLVPLLERCKAALYILILVIAFYWGSKQQYLYLWDELIWVCGFLIIDWNIHRPRAVQSTEPLGSPGLRSW